MSIFKYKILNPVKDPKLPFYDNKKGIFYIPLNKKYRYFIEASTYDEDKGYSYFLLLSAIKFNLNCRLCNTDNYGRVKVNIGGEFKDFVVKESEERGNVNIDYVETVDCYDVFNVH